MIKLLPGQWIGLDQISAQEFAKLRPSAERAVVKAANHFVNAVKRKLTGSRSGRIYRIGKRGRTHQASAPGEAPAVLYGTLRNSITAGDPEWTGDNVVVKVGTNVVYAAILEYGGVTANGGRILPRPYMAATMLEEQDRMQTILDGSVLNANINSSVTEAPIKGAKSTGSGGRRRDARGRFI
jgi:phage gpG-like protein